jgi:CRISPR-associated protein Csb2
MPGRALLITVRLLEGRYHGLDDWPPAPFRLFQALVAGAYGGRWRAEPESAQQQKNAAFDWLERLDPPHIATPAKLNGRGTTYFVPNNDLDAVGGDPQRVAEIRAAKVVRPILFAIDTPFLYAWPFDGDDTQARLLCELTARLHTLGRGVDPAFATAEILDWMTAESRLRAHGGAIARPAEAAGDDKLVPCPMMGSLTSLRARHEFSRQRFTTRREGNSVVMLFRQPPKALYLGVAYDRPVRRFLFDLRPVDGGRPFQPISQDRVARVAKAVRDRMAERLTQALPGRAGEIERFIIGRGATDADKARRIRVLPLPSIGMEHTDPAIRRVLIEVPPDCPIAAEDVLWSVSGQSICDHIGRETGEILAEGPVLVPAENARMLAHYGIGAPSSKRWQTATPAALPERRPAGRIGGAARAAAEGRAAAAVGNALRQAGFDPAGIAVRVQNEPLHRNGLRSEAFYPDRFERRSLRHIEITFPRALRGPIVIGDGRWLGLGLMRPVTEQPPALHLFALEGDRIPSDRAEALAGALRRAVMARVQQQVGRGQPLPTFFSGHRPNGTPACSGQHEHLFFFADDGNRDGYLDRVAIIAPRLADRRVTADHRRHLRQLWSAIADMVVLRAGSAGAPRLVSIAATDETDPVFGCAKHWVSRTRYRPTRHPRDRRNEDEALRRDLLLECERRGLPRPDVKVISVASGPRGGISGHLHLAFSVAIAGPLLLGAGSHFGSGLFAAEPDCRRSAGPALCSGADGQ